MNAERDQGEFAPKAIAQRRLFRPTWYLRLRLRSIEYSIARLEQQLAREFAVLEAAPMHRELKDLMAEQERLRRQLQAGR